MPHPTRSVELDVGAVLFDMDGTLIDSTPAVDRAWATWQARWNVRLPMRASALGRPARSIVAEHLAAEHVEEAFADIERLETEDTAGIVLLPGARALLSALPAGRWAIATSCSAPLAAARLGVVGIVPPVLIVANDTARGKPSPDPYLAAAQRLGADPADCLVVEDAVAGVAAGRAAGCTVLGVLGSAPAEALGADLVAAALTDVRATAKGDRIRLTIDALA